MKREILQQMIEIAGSNRAGDLSYDIMSLTGYEGQFVWSTYGTKYTVLQKCSKELIKRELNTERGMYRYACNSFQPLLFNWYSSKFYWYGADENDKLVEITMEQAISLCKKQYEDALNEWESEGNELPKDITIGSLKINCPLEYLQEQLNYAGAHNDKSLSDILHRFESRNRVAKNHYIQIDKDYEERSFIFTEVVNGVTELTGGIIFHGYPNEGYKEGGSVQLTRSYGWCVHT